MRKIGLAIVVLLLILLCFSGKRLEDFSQKEALGSVKVLADSTKHPKYIVNMDIQQRQEIERLLKLFATYKRGKTKEATIIYIARQFVGVPYVAHSLDKTDDERLVITLKGMDCSTYVENVVAFAYCAFKNKTTCLDFLNAIRLVRYRGGNLSYENRLHYFDWWLEDNEKKGLVEEISSLSKPFTSIQTLKINYMSENYLLYEMLKNHPERVKALKLLEDKTNGKVVRYIPTSQLNNATTLRSVVHNGDILGLVTNKKNLDTTHLGIAVWHKDGLYLLNASSLKKNGSKVVEPTETLYDYLKARPYNLGIRVARIVGDSKA